MLGSVSRDAQQPGDFTLIHKLHAQNVSFSAWIQLRRKPCKEDKSSHPTFQQVITSDCPARKIRIWVSIKIKTVFTFVVFGFRILGIHISNTIQKFHQFYCESWWKNYIMIPNIFRLSIYMHIHMFTLHNIGRNQPITFYKHTFLLNF